jgi:hypothetical protein
VEKPLDVLVSLLRSRRGGRALVGVGTIGLKSVLVRETPVRTGVIFDLRIRKAARRLGLATAVTEALEAFAWGDGCGMVFLAVNGDNKPARELYEKQGYRLCSKRSMGIAISPVPISMGVLPWVISRAAGLYQSSAFSSLIASGALPELPDGVRVLTREIDGSVAREQLIKAWSSTVDPKFLTEQAKPGTDLVAPVVRDDVVTGLLRGCGESHRDGMGPPDLAPCAAPSMIADDSALASVEARVEPEGGGDGSHWGWAQVSLMEASSTGGMMLVHALGLPASVWKSNLLAYGLTAALVAGACGLNMFVIPQHTDGWVTPVCQAIVGVFTALLVTTVGVVSTMASVVGAPAGAFGDDHHTISPPRVRARLFAPACAGPLGPRLLAEAAREAIAEAGRQGYTMVITNAARGHPFGTALGVRDFHSVFLWKPRPMDGVARVFEGPISPYDCFDIRDL